MEIDLFDFYTSIAALRLSYTRTDGYGSSTRGEFVCGEMGGEEGWREVKYPLVVVCDFAVGLNWSKCIWRVKPINM